MNSPFRIIIIIIILLNVDLVIFFSSSSIVHMVTENYIHHGRKLAWNFFSAFNTHTHTHILSLFNPVFQVSTFFFNHNDDDDNDGHTLTFNVIRFIIICGRSVLLFMFKCIYFDCSFWNPTHTHTHTHEVWIWILEKKWNLFNM